MRLGRIFAEDLVEAATAGKQMKRIVENQERLWERVDDRQRKSLRLCTISKFLHVVVLHWAGASHYSQPPARLLSR
jgi:hypothetical protein